MRIKHLALLLPLLLIFDGCHRSGQTGGKSAVLRYPIIQEPASFDPAKLNDIYITEMLQNVYEGLTTFDAQNNVIPCLAEKWEISPDGKTYTFHLRTNAVFHNGRPVTADDFKYSFERALRPETISPTAADYLGRIVGAADIVAGKTKELVGAKVVDPHTLVLTIDKPRGYFLGCMTYPCTWVVCKEMMPGKASEFNYKEAVGTGPFRVTNYRSGSQVTLEAFDKYWGGRPKLDRIERPIGVDMATFHVQFENGEVDAFINVSLSDYATDQKSEKLRPQLQLLPQANVFYMVMHPKLQKEFADVRVRRAFAMAIDREKISKLAYHDACPPAYGFIPPGLAGANPNIRKIPYDPAGARKLLAEAGFPDGKDFPRLTLEHVQKQTEQANAAQIIRDNLKQNLGIEIDIHEHEMVSFFHDTANQEKIPFFLTGWIADYADPQDFLSTLLRTGASLNHQAYSNPTFDRLCDEADTLSDMSKRIPLYQQADQIAMDDVAVMPVVFFNQPVLVKPYVKGAESNLMLMMLPHKKTEVVR